MKRGHRMCSGQERRSQRGVSARISIVSASDCDRERLLRAACKAGLQPSVVVEVAETLTGRAWACLGAPDIATVARELLSAANRVACRPNDEVRPCAKRAE